MAPLFAATDIFDIMSFFPDLFRPVIASHLAF